MSFGAFFKKQLSWAEKYTDVGADEARVQWWKDRITELEKREAEELPPTPPASAAGDRGERKVA